MPKRMEKSELKDFYKSEFKRSSYTRFFIGNDIRSSYWNRSGYFG